MKEKVYKSSMIGEWTEAFSEVLVNLNRTQNLFNDVQGDPAERIGIWVHLATELIEFWASISSSRAISDKATF